MALLGEPKHADGSDGPVVTTSLWVAGRHHDISYHLSRGPVATGWEPFLAASLLLAMRAGEALQIPGVVSPRLLEGVERIQDIFHVWDRRLKRVAVESLPGLRAAAASHRRGVACFFSGGVDSFYSLLKNAGEITALIFVHGWDVSLDDGPLRAKVSEAIGAAARQVHKPLIEVETDLYAMRKGYVKWRFYHGAALASVALLLSPLFHRVIIPASHSYSQLFPWGSHPLLDPLWSTEDTELVHDGCEATRTEKVVRIASSDAALQWLRVCFENREGTYNCGQCEKCLRTMVSLRAAGVLGRCSAFDRPLDLDAVSRMEIREINVRGFAEDNLRFVEKHARDPALAEALRECLRRATVPEP